MRREVADEYADYIRETGFSAYAATPGNRGSWMLRRDSEERTEFLTFSLWDSYEAIRSFAGEDIETAVYYPKDDEFLIERDERVTHYEVADEG